MPFAKSAKATPTYFGSLTGALDYPWVGDMDPKRTALDPFRALIGVLERRGNSDTLRAAANSAGLVFDPSLSNRDAYSHTTRIRALVPRILAAYDSLEEQDQLSVARAVLVSTHDAEITATLQKLGGQSKTASWW